MIISRNQRIKAKIVQIRPIINIFPPLIIPLNQKTAPIIIERVALAVRTGHGEFSVR
jgi:hypothetical protein